MRWTLKQKSWRSALMKIALLTVLWLIVAFVFATEFYLSARGMPIQISWTDAARSASRDWFPWMLLSPIAVILAGRFRFDRETWRKSLLIHLAACGVFTLAYEGLVYRSPFNLFGGRAEAGVSFFSTADPILPQLPGIGGSIETVGPPLPGREGSNAVFFESRHLNSGGGEMSFSVRSNNVLIERGEPLNAPLHQVRVGFSNLPASSQWTQFLHFAVARTQFTVPIYLCIICICWVINHFQETAERERRTLELETRLTQANLQALKMQLQPHFLFNTLNTISSLVHENPNVAEDMVCSLSQFLRTTLDVSSENEIPLRRELEFVERYLEIQKTRFDGRLQICREIDATVLEALVPPLILQPLVENAVRHGIEAREGSGTVSIRATRSVDMLRLEIADDGEGFKGGQLLEIQKGIGISNTKARLQELYGDNHQFKLTANEPLGACVRIEIPFTAQTTVSETRT
jgi:hypothetical protein